VRSDSLKMFLNGPNFRAKYCGPKLKITQILRLISLITPRQNYLKDVICLMWQIPYVNFILFYFLFVIGKDSVVKQVL